MLFFFFVFSLYNEQYDHEFFLKDGFVGVGAGRGLLIT